MKILKILTLIFFSVFVSTQAYGFISFDMLGYGGYSSFEENGSSQKTEGYYAAVSALLSTSGPIAMTIGAGGHMMQTKGTVNGATTTISDTSVLGHLGFRLSSPFARIYLLGNGGYGLNGKAEGSGSSEDLKNHMFYGGTFMALMSFSRMVKFGVTGTYNVHKYELVSTKHTAHELSGGVVIGIGL
jgi:hypothetical protein